MELYLALPLEKAYQVGQKPATPEIIDTVLSKHIDDLEPGSIAKTSVRQRVPYSGRNQARRPGVLAMASR